MSDPNEDAKNKIAKAIVYAARQAFMINSYGMTWEAIEVNTANILAGCSIPADGKMNSAEAVSNHIYEMLKRGLMSPYEARTALVEPVSPGDPTVLRVALELVDKYHEQKDELARTKEALRIECVAAMEARQEALANKVDRDDFAQKWATLKGECHAQNQRANQAEKDNAELLRLLNAARADLKGSELCRDQLRRDLETARRELELALESRDTWRGAASVAAKERDAAEAKVVMLRTFLQLELGEYYTLHDGIENILEETK